MFVLTLVDNGLLGAASVGKMSLFTSRAWNSYVRSVIVVFFMSFVMHASGHGISARSLSGFMAIEFTYSDGAAVSFADVEVFAPGEDGVFQSGQSDLEGRYAFVPSGEGVWRIRIDDGLGHMLEHLIHVDASMQPTPAMYGSTWSKAARAGLGIGMILSAFGCWALFRARKI